MTMMDFLSKIKGAMGLPGASGGGSGMPGGAGLGGLASGLLRGIGSGRGLKPAGPQPVDPGAQDFLNSFSPEDQGNIRGSWGSNPNAQNDWFNNARAAGAVPPPPAAAPPGAGTALMAKAMAGMGAPPQPNQMAQDVLNERRKFRMGKMGGKPAGPRGGGFTGMGIGAPRDDGMWSRPGME